MHDAQNNLVGPQSALFLDFDGTLADLANRPEAVNVAPGLVETLTRLSALLDGALAVVSGRSIAQLDAFLAPLELPSAGVHGAERRRADGHLLHAQVSISPDVIRSLQSLADTHPGILIETKPGAVALHYRMAPQLEALCLSAMHRAASYTPGCSLQLGKMVAELKPTGASKGVAIEAFLGEAPFVGRAPVFVGDDITDEAGFEAVQSRGGIGVKVGPGETQAKVRLPSPSAVRAWLTETCDRLDARRRQDIDLSAVSARNGANVRTVS